MVQHLFSDVVKHHADIKHHADNTRVSKADMAFAYLELTVWWGKGHKTDTQLLFQSVINAMKEKYEGGAMKVYNRKNWSSVEFKKSFLEEVILMVSRDMGVGWGYGEGGAVL